MGISFAKGVERPITVMGIEKKKYRSVSVGQRVTVCWLAICLVFRPHSRYILTNARMTQYSGGTWMRVTVRSACVRACVMILMVMAKPHQLFFEALSFRALSESWEGGNERPQGTADAKANLKRQCHRRTTRHWAADYRRQQAFRQASQSHLSRTYYYIVHTRTW